MAQFRVIDALDAPYGGRILRLRLNGGDPPPIRSLVGSTATATGPDDERIRVRVEGFPVFGGKPSDERLKRSGRLDLHVVAMDAEPASLITFDWELRTG